jgi:hypothetical protein
MTKAHLTLVTPGIVNRTVTPRRRPNVDLRTREHLTEPEVQCLMDAARKNRWGHRDATMILVAYRHGFRPAELVDLRWEQIEFASARCTSAGSSVARQAPIRSSATNFVRYGAFSANRSPSLPLCSLQSVERHSQPLASPAWLNGQAPRRGLASRRTRTCSGMPVATRWRTGDTTQGRCKPTWGTRTSSTRCVTPSYPPCGLRTFGGSERRP